MRRHVGAQTLAGFRHGDLSPRRTSRIRAHLADCTRCRDLSSDLAGVTTLLAAAQPPPIPEHLAARIQTALAEEAARRTAQAPASEAGTRVAGTGGPATPARGAGGRSPRHGPPGRARRRPLLPGLSSPVALRVAAGAAAAVVVAGGTYELVQHVGGSSSPNSGAAAPGATVPRPAGPLIASGSAPGLHYLHDGHQTSITPVTTSVNFTSANLRGEVSSELSRHAAARAAGPAAAGPAGQPTARFAPTSAAALEGCLNRVAAGHEVLLVEIGHYQGAPATVIVTAGAGTGSPQVWVVGAGCSAADSDVLAHVTLAPGG